MKILRITSDVPGMALREGDIVMLSDADADRVLMCGAGYQTTASEWRETSALRRYRRGMVRAVNDR